MLDAPFGLIFNTSLFLAIVGLILSLILIIYLFIKSKKIIIKLSGLSIAIITILVLISIVLVKNDYRILYFRSAVPHPEKVEWQEDLSYLSSQMRTIHPNIYSMIQKRSLDSLENTIFERIPNSDDSDILMDLFNFTAAPNDAHTFPFIFFPCYDLHNVPLQIYGFTDGWYVVEAGREYKKLIGLKILEIGSTDINEIFKNHPLLLGVENTQSQKERFTYMVVMPEWLKYHKIIDEIDKVDFTFEDQNGKTYSKSLPSYKYFPLFVWSNVSKISNNQPHIFTNPRKDWYEFTPIIDSRYLYIEYHQCDNQPGKETVTEFALDLETHIKNNNYERYLIDLRSNDGGNNNVNRELLRVVRDTEKVNQHGKLYILIGRRTFSAAVMFANQLQMQTEAIFVGESTSQGPIFYGRPNIIELPNSKLVIGISSGRTISSLSFDMREEIKPDIEVEYTIDDFHSKMDPVLEAALHHTVKESIQIESMNNTLNLEGNYSLSPRDYATIYKDGDNLYLNITDYVPNSMTRFMSKLYLSDKNLYRTNVNGISLTTTVNGNSNRLFLNWFGTIVEMIGSSEDNKLAMKSLMNGEIEIGIKEIHNDKDLYIDLYQDLEQILNSLGYQLMGNDNLIDAVRIFELSTELFPESSNVYDSLAESYMKNGQTDLAIKNYTKSLELNPRNANAIEMLKQLK